MSKTPRSQRNAPRPQTDPRIVAVFHATPTGFVGLVARRAAQGIDVLAVREFAAEDGGAGAWADAQLAGRRVVVLQSASVIARAVQLPRAPEDKLASALDLNATTFVLGRTPAFRVAASMLPGEHGEAGLRTGLVAEWPIDQPAPALPLGMLEKDRVTFAPEVAALAVLASASSDPLVSVDLTHGTVTVAAPTSKGVLVRIIRAGAEDGGVDASEIARALGEACVHAEVPTSEIKHAVERTRAAADDALSGGLGCTAKSIKDLTAIVKVQGQSDPAQWWRQYGVAAAAAVAALGSCVPLTQLHSHDPGARPDRTGAMLNRLAEPRMASRLLVAALLVIAFGPLAFQGLRLLVLRWKLPDVVAFEQAEHVDEQKRALYRMLARNSASVTKTLSDLAACTPEGIEVEFVNVAQSVKGQAITLRGKALTAKNAQGVDAILTLEQLLRKSGMFEAITRSSDPPDQRGYQNFSIAAVAVRPTEIARYPDGQRWEEKTLREVKYGPFPPDGDRVASGLDEPPPGSAAATAEPSSDAGSGSANSAAHVAGEPASERSPSRGSVAGSTRTHGGRTTTTSGSAPATQLPIPADMTPPGTTPAVGEAAAAAPGATPPSPPSTPPGAGPDPAAPADGTVAGGRAAPKGARPAPKGSQLGGSSAPEPPPSPLTEAEINAMSKAQAQSALATVSRARARADLDDEVKARLRTEFELLLERCKRD